MKIPLITQRLKKFLPSDPIITNFIKNWYNGSKEYKKEKLRITIEEDAAALKIVSPAYAGDEGELCAVLQYIYQHILFDNMGCKDYANILLKIAITEMKHLEILGKLILKLGAAPVYSYLPPYPINYFSARTVSYSKNPQKMILDDIAAEQYAIDTYTKILCRVKNEQVAAVIQRIRMDEEEHLSTFKCIFKEMSTSC